MWESRATARVLAARRLIALIWIGQHSGAGRLLVVHEFRSGMWTRQRNVRLAIRLLSFVFIRRHARLTGLIVKRSGENERSSQYYLSMVPMRLIFFCSSITP
jgi:hypothetical protein